MSKLVEEDSLAVAIAKELGGKSGSSEESLKQKKQKKDKDKTAAPSVTEQKKKIEGILDLISSWRLQISETFFFLFFFFFPFLFPLFSSLLLFLSTESEENEERFEASFLIFYYFKLTI